MRSLSSIQKNCSVSCLQRVRLSEIISQSINSGLRKIKLNPYENPMETMYESWQVLEKNLNHGVLSTIERMSSKDAMVSALLIERVPTCFDVLPPTPKSDDNTNQKDFMFELFLLGLAQILGCVPYINIDEKDGQVIQQVIPVEGHEQSISGIGSREPFDAHTENAHEENPPDFFALGCLRGDEKAFTSYLPIDQVLYSLPRWVVSILLSKKFIFTTGPSYRERKQILQSVLTCHNGIIDIRYNHNPERLSAINSEAAKALYYLREFLSINSLFHVCLKPGDVLIINNSKCLHGRTTFKMSENPDIRRWLQRIYFKKVIAD